MSSGLLSHCSDHLPAASQLSALDVSGVEREWGSCDWASPVRSLCPISHSLTFLQGILRCHGVEHREEGCCLTAVFSMPGAGTWVFMLGWASLSLLQPPSYIYNKRVLGEPTYIAVIDENDSNACH